MSTPLRSAIARNLTVARIAVTVGLPATMLAFLSIAIVLEATGLAGAERLLASRLELVGLLGCSLLIGLQVATEVAAVRVDGMQALNRGSRPVAVARYLVLIGAAGFVLVAVTWVGLSAAVAVVRGDPIEPGLVLGLVGAYVLYRSARAFVAGLRRTEDERTSSTR